jgi:hypothetical protein
MPGDDAERLDRERRLADARDDGSHFHRLLIASVFAAHGAGLVTIVSLVTPTLERESLALAAATTDALRLPAAIFFGGLVSSGFHVVASVIDARIAGQAIEGRLHGVRTPANMNEIVLLGAKVKKVAKFFFLISVAAFLIGAICLEGALRKTIAKARAAQIDLEVSETLNRLDDTAPVPRQSVR